MRLDWLNKEILVYLVNYSEDDINDDFMKSKTAHTNHPFRRTSLSAASNLGFLIVNNSVDSIEKPFLFIIVNNSILLIISKLFL